jgi:Ca-activated chloride channel family protein
VALSRAKLLTGTNEAFVAVELLAPSSGARPPLDLAIALDRSGSMRGEKIERARDAVRALASRLGGADRLALVEYDSRAELTLSGVAADSAGQQALAQALARVRPRGNTNLGAGLTLARDELLRMSAAEPQARRLARILLVSDGRANVGVVDPRALAHLAADAADRGLHTTSIGLGLDYNEDLMQSIALEGRGNYYYVRDARALGAVLTGEATAWQSTVTTEAELSLEPTCRGVEVAEVFGYATTRRGGATVVKLSDLSAGEARKVVARLRVPTAGIGPERLVRAELSFGDATSGGRQRAFVDVGVEITNDSAAAEASADPDVLGRALEAEAGRELRLASEEYSAGHRQSAAHRLDAWKRKAAAEGARYRIPEVHAHRAVVSVNDLAALVGGTAPPAPTSAAGLDAVKAAKGAAGQLAR